MKKIFWRVAVYFTVALIVLTGVAGLVFMRFNRRNVMNVYKEELKSLAQSVSQHVTESMTDDDVENFSAYLSAIKDFGDIRNADIWIFANPDSPEPLNDRYVNVDISSIQPDKEVDKWALVTAAFHGKTKSYSGMDPVYGVDIMHIATPIKNARGEYVGAVMINGEMDYRENSIMQYQRYMMMSILIAFGISLLIAVFFSRQLVRPIIRIKEIALKMAAGEYAQKTEIQRKDELGLLADSMDILSERLVEVEEFRENLERNRRDFFSNVSHELRTPITVVKGYTETLADGYVEEREKQQEYYDRILHECAGMERLVSDLLILSKMQNPDFELETEVLNVIAVMQDSMRSMRVILGEKNIEAKLSYEDECSLIEGDYDRIRQLFLVFLENAAKYADEDTEIFIRIGRQNGIISVEVEDTGIPIAREAWDHVFEKFYRADNHGNKDGSGLGLMVARHIVERHHGKIWVTSDEVCKVCFHVEFHEVREEDLDG